jgi:hypothetical protein
VDPRLDTGSCFIVLLLLLLLLLLWRQQVKEMLSSASSNSNCRRHPLPLLSVLICNLFWTPQYWMFRDTLSTLCQMLRFAYCHIDTKGNKGCEEKKRCDLFSMKFQTSEERRWGKTLIHLLSESQAPWFYVLVKYASLMPPHLFIWRQTPYLTDLHHIGWFQTWCRKFLFIYI